MDCGVKLADVKSHGISMLAEDAFQELVDKPDRSSGFVVNKRASLELYSACGVMKVDVNSSNERLIC